jgi:hypothetical protein
MFCPNQQMPLLNSVDQLPKYKQELLKKGWPGIFHDKIFPYINEWNFAVLYSKNPATCPNSPVNVLVGLLIVKEVLDLTDEELIGSFYFDDRIQYALHTLDSGASVSINTLTNFRNRVVDYLEKTGIDLIHGEVSEMAKRIANSLNVDPRLIRMDSLMISSSCRKLSRIELIYRVNALVVKTLSKAGITIPESCLGYLEKGHKNNTIYRTTNQEADSKLKTLFEQSEALYQTAFAAGEKIMSTRSFNCLERLLNEQTVQTDGKRAIKPGKEIAPNSLQNPSAPDATFRKKNNETHLGYVGNLVNAYNENGQVIMDYDLKQNIYSDSQFTADQLDKIPEDNTELITIVTDGAFYSDELNQKAPPNVRLIPGELTGAKPDETKLGYDQFRINAQTHEVEACPDGKKSIDSSYDSETDTYTAKMAKPVCDNCRLRGECPIQTQKKANVVRFSGSRYRNDLLRGLMETEEYRKLTNSRAGIEGLPSVLRRRYDVDYMPIRGLVRSKIWFGFKIAAMNFKSLVKATRKRNTAQLAFLYFVFKERFFGSSKVLNWIFMSIRVRKETFFANCNF